MSQDMRDQLPQFSSNQKEANILRMSIQSYEKSSLLGGDVLSTKEDQGNNSEDSFTSISTDIQKAVKQKLSSI